jgi:hypothetical protein
MFGFEVIEGKYGSVSLNGVRFVVGAKYPGPIHEGSGDVVLFVDEKASPAQVDAVATIITGQAGGMPWEALAGTVGSFEGPIRKPIRSWKDGSKWKRERLNHTPRLWGHKGRWGRVPRRRCSRRPWRQCTATVHWRINGRCARIIGLFKAA